MKYLLLITFTLLVNLSFGQEGKLENIEVAENFDKFYNAENYEGIFSMFAEVMKEALPLDKTTEFLTGLKFQTGNIVSREFIKYENGTYASYRTTFDNVVFTLNISIDDSSKINGLLILPFAEEQSTEDVINNLSAQDDYITKKQTKIIFNHVKDFPNKTQVSIAIIKNGEVNYYGVKQDNDTLSTTNNFKSTFEIGSITKVFTSTLLSEFVSTKKIKLNDPINNYLDLSFNNDIQITFESLANHTSGLPRLPSNLDLSKINPNNPYKEYGEKKLVDYLTNTVTRSQKDKLKYEYSNLGAGLIGYTLSKIENVSYDSLLHAKIFSKYNMFHSTTTLKNVKGVLIKGQDQLGNEVPNWEFLALAGAGGILSTTEDLSKFAIAQFDLSNKELELPRQKTFEINDNMSIGLAWHIIKSKSGNSLIWHNGGTGGYTSSMAIDLERKNGIIILSNVSAFNPDMGNIDKLCFELIETLEDE